MTAPPVSGGTRGIEQKSPGLIGRGAYSGGVVSCGECRGVSRVVAPSGFAAPCESSIAARYTSRVVDNSPALCGGNSRLAAGNERGPKDPAIDAHIRLVSNASPDEAIR
jgi:hypothetical protein